MTAVDPADALRALRDQFLRGSEARILRMSEAIRRLREEPADREALRSLWTEFHGFSGLGGTYGFPRVSALGREGEARGDAFFAPEPAPLSSADLAAWDALLAAIRTDLGLDREESVPRVLAVMHDRAEGSALRSVLEMAGYDVRVVSADADLSAERASFRPDLLILDPGTDVGQTPVLILGRGGPGGSAGPEDGRVRLAKPFEPGDLLSAVASCLSPVRGG